jgi:thiol-disulfide isomerase/thioredoxin
VSGYDYTGNPITIDATTSGPTLVVVLAHWCPHCAREIPVLNAWHDSGDVPAGLQVVGLSTAIDANAQNYPPDQWLAAVNWRWRVLADDQQRAALTAFGGTSFPTMIFVGPDGLVRWRISGEYPVEEIQERVDAAMASSVPATTSTSTAAATETAPPSVAAATTATTATTAATTAIVATQPETNALATG